MSESEFVFRSFSLEDRPFIESSWASSYYAASRIKDALSPEDFHAFHRPLRARFFDRPSATVIVVSPADDPHFILGWIAVEVLPNCSVIHYAYIKSNFRREYGLLRKLISRAVHTERVLYTHLTPKAMKIMATHQDEIRLYQFCPHLT